MKNKFCKINQNLEQKDTIERTFFQKARREFKQE